MLIARRGTNKRVALISWIPSHEGAIKTNYDVALKENWISAAVCSGPRRKGII